MNINTILEEFEDQFASMLNLVEAHTGQSERENIRQFLTDQIRKAYNSGYNDCKDGKDMVEL